MSIFLGERWISVVGITLFACMTFYFERWVAWLRMAWMASALLIFSIYIMDTVRRGLGLSNPAREFIE